MRLSEIRAAAVEFWPDRQSFDDVNCRVANFPKTSIEERSHFRASANSPQRICYASAGALAASLNCCDAPTGTAALVTAFLAATFRAEIFFAAGARLLTAFRVAAFLAGEAFLLAAFFAGAAFLAGVEFSFPTA